MTEYKKLQIIKHALQHYVQREGATDSDIQTEKKLLADVCAYVERLQERFNIPVPPVMPNPLAIMWDEKATELRNIMQSKYADKIIDAVKADANMYTLSEAIARLNVFVHLALKGTDAPLMLDAANNYYESILLWYITAAL